VAIELPARVVPCAVRATVSGPSGPVSLSDQTTLLLDHEDLDAVHAAANGGKLTFTMEVDTSGLPSTGG
jgi:hypothetical protein